MLKRHKNGLLGAILLVIVAAGCWVFYSERSTHAYRTAQPLDVAAYMANGNSLTGNIYRLEGKVLDSLAWSPSGRLIAVGMEGHKMAIPVLLPEKLGTFNIEKGERLKFLVVVDEKGVLRAQRLMKS